MASRDKFFGDEVTWISRVPFAGEWVSAMNRQILFVTHGTLTLGVMCLLDTRIERTTRLFDERGKIRHMYDERLMDLTQSPIGTKIEMVWIKVTMDPPNRDAASESTEK
jgi:hypothetical protein